MYINFKVRCKTEKHNLTKIVPSLYFLAPQLLKYYRFHKIFFYTCVSRMKNWHNCFVNSCKDVPPSPLEHSQMSFRNKMI